MKDTLSYIVTRLVDHPEDVSIDELRNEDSIILTIHAHTEDMGKIIGKSGRIIRAIRDLMKVLATKENIFVDVVVADEDKPSSSNE